MVDQQNEKNRPRDCINGREQLAALPVRRVGCWFAGNQQPHGSLLFRSRRRKETGLVPAVRQLRTHHGSRNQTAKRPCVDLAWQQFVNGLLAFFAQCLRRPNQLPCRFAMTRRPIAPNSKQPRTCFQRRWRLRKWAWCWALFGLAFIGRRVPRTPSRTRTHDVATRNKWHCPTARSVVPNHAVDVAKFNPVRCCDANLGPPDNRWIRGRIKQPDQVLDRLKTALPAPSLSETWCHCKRTLTNQRDRAVDSDEPSAFYSTL